MNWFELVPIAFVAILGFIVLYALWRGPRADEQTIPRSECPLRLLEGTATGTREHKLKLSAFGWFAVPLDQLTGPLRWISSIISC